MIIKKENKYYPLKPPIGIIYVCDDVNKGWITDKIAFYEWNKIKVDNPENYGLTWNDVIDIDKINEVLAIMCKKDNLLSVHPAFGRSGFAMDSYYHDLGTYGDWGDYIKIICPSCNYSWYFNQRKIPIGKIYECTCPKCEMSLRRKKV